MTEKETIEYLNSIDPENKKNILLHSCCGPCTSGVYPQIEKYFNVSVLYYDPNIYPKEEYDKRYEALQLLNKYFPFKIIEIGYNREDFLKVVKGHEKDAEGGDRCEICFRLRMRETAIYAKEHGFDCFTSTLSVSPYKNADVLNKIGQELEDELGIKYLYSNFKKKEGYKISIENSKKYGLYRQTYCGCEFSKCDEKKH